jgi:hypothetical protein
MPHPVRLHLSRKKGFNLQELSRMTNGLRAVNVARPSIFGNPFTVENARDTGYRGTDEAIAELAVNCFRRWVGGSARDWMGDQSERQRRALLNKIEMLRGKNLACWCKPGAPCHADALIELANRPVCEEVMI